MARKSRSSEDGWTKEQEAKLRQAHLLVRATPNFWRDIAKLVPGKTANECFNKFYAAHPTPPAVARTPKRPRLTTSPIKPLGKLLSPTSLLKQKKTTKTGKSKSSIVKSHKTVREILRKQQIADLGYEEDAFAALESSDVPLWGDKLTSSSSPKPKRRKANVKPCSSKASSSSSKPSPSLMDSPEVLKKHYIGGRKHDRYLDLLVRRNKLPSAKKNAKKAEASKTRLGSTSDLSAAKCAVIASARDVLEQAASSVHNEDEDQLFSETDSESDSI